MIQVSYAQPHSPKKETLFQKTVKDAITAYNQKGAKKFNPLINKDIGFNILIKRGPLDW